jgi:hypothetical protein
MSRIKYMLVTSSVKENVLKQCCSPLSASHNTNSKKHLRSVIMMKVPSI